MDVPQPLHGDDVCATDTYGGTEWETRVRDTPGPVSERTSGAHRGGLGTGSPSLPTGARAAEDKEGGGGWMRDKRRPSARSLVAATETADSGGAAD